MKQFLMRQYRSYSNSLYVIEKLLEEDFRSCWKEIVELEEIVELAARKMDILQRRKALKKSREVFKDLAHAALETYTGKPIYDEGPVYDEEPGEVQEWWPEKEFISAALGGEPKSHNSCERSEGGDDIQVIQDNLCLYCPEFEDFPHIWKQICILLWPKEEIAKSLANKTSGYGGRNYIKFGEQIVHTFDPGGYVPDDQSKEFHKLKRKVYVVQFVDSADLRDQDIQKSNGEVDRILSKMNQQAVVPMGAGLKVLPFRYHYMVLEQNRPEINKTTEGYEVSRINVTIHIFDPGGDQYTSYKVETVMKTALLHKNLYLAVEQGRRTFMRT